MSVLFILGAGASVDSGLKTYRGAGGHYDDAEDAEQVLHTENLVKNPAKIWAKLEPILFHTARVPGPTYAKIDDICGRYDRALILTQNIDRLALYSNYPVIQLHGSNKSMTCMHCGTQLPLQYGQYKCPRDGHWMRPDIVLFDEYVPDEYMKRINLYITLRKPSECYIIGTTLQFPYLHKIISKAKQNGAKAIYVNPEPMAVMIDDNDQLITPAEFLALYSET